MKKFTKNIKKTMVIAKKDPDESQSQNPEDQDNEEEYDSDD
jgi:hypothetical protein